MRVIATRPWAVAISVAAHVGAVAAMLLWPEPRKSGATAEGMGGIEIVLGPVGGTIGAPSETVEPVEPVEDVAAEPVDVIETVDAVDALEETPEETVAEAVPEDPLPMTEPVAEPVDQPPEEITAEAPDALELPVPPAETETAVVAQTLEAAEQATEPVDAPAPQRKPDPPPARPRQPPAATQMARLPEPAATERPAPPAGAPVEQQGPSSAQQAGVAFTPSSGGGNPGALQDYLAQVRGWVERYKHYPDRARARRQEGAVLLAFTLDRQGNVLGQRIIQSSGYDLLDRAAADIIARASPFPPMPDDLPGTRLDLQLPIPFDLR